MIPATEALALPCAQLNDSEKDAADKFEAFIEEHIKTSMGRNGVDLTTAVTNANVVAEVNQRVRAAGWTTLWTPLVEKHRFNQAQNVHTGFKLSLFPTDEAYRAAARSALS